MDPKAVFQKNLVYITRELRSLNSEFLDKLEQGEFLGHDEKEQIDAQSISFDKCDKLYNILMRQGLTMSKERFEKFLTILDDTGNGNVADKLRSTAGRSKPRTNPHRAKPSSTQAVDLRRVFIENVYNIAAEFRHLNDKFLSELVKAEILERYEKEEIAVKTVKAEKCEKLFTTLMKKEMSEDGFDKFLSILDTSGNGEVANHLRSATGRKISPMHRSSSYESVETESHEFQFTNDRLSGIAEFLSKEVDGQAWSRIWLGLLMKEMSKEAMLGVASESTLADTIFKCMSVWVKKSSNESIMSDILEAVREYDVQCAEQLEEKIRSCENESFG